MNEQGWIERFEAFSRSKPADEKYASWEVKSCALAQFGYSPVCRSNAAEMGVPLAAYEAATQVRPFTFGALADRLAAIVEPGK